MDAICIILLYSIFMLNLLGLKMVFWFKVIVTVCTAKLIISLLKVLLGIPNRVPEYSNFWRCYYKIAVTFGSSVMCSMLTAMSSRKVIGIFYLVLIVIVLIALLIKNFYIRTTMLMALSAGYGIILAKWYQRHPLDGSFGNVPKESLGIALSAIMMLLPILILCHQEQFDCVEKNRAGE